MLESMSYVAKLLSYIIISLELMMLPSYRPSFNISLDGLGLPSLLYLEAGNLLGEEQNVFKRSIPLKEYSFPMRKRKNKKTKEKNNKT